MAASGAPGFEVLRLDSALIQLESALAFFANDNHGGSFEMLSA
jgi:hypothetical protein